MKLTTLSFATLTLCSSLFAINTQDTLPEYNLLKQDFINGEINNERSSQIILKDPRLVPKSRGGMKNDVDADKDGLGLLVIGKLENGRIGSLSLKNEKENKKFNYLLEKFGNQAKTAGVSVVEYVQNEFNNDALSESDKSELIDLWKNNEIRTVVVSSNKTEVDVGSVFTVTYSIDGNDKDGQMNQSWNIDDSVLELISDNEGEAVFKLIDVNLAKISLTVNGEENSINSEELLVTPKVYTIATLTATQDVDARASSQTYDILATYYVQINLRRIFKVKDYNKNIERLYKFDGYKLINAENGETIPYTVNAYHPKFLTMGSNGMYRYINPNELNYFGPPSLHRVAYHDNVSDYAIGNSQYGSAQLSTSFSSKIKASSGRQIQSSSLNNGILYLRQSNGTYVHLNDSECNELSGGRGYTAQTIKDSSNRNVTRCVKSNATCSDLGPGWSDTPGYAGSYCSIILPLNR